MEQTTNLGLKKSGYDDFGDVEVLNENWDKIDAWAQGINQAIGKPVVRKVLVALKASSWDTASNAQAVAVQGILADESKQLIVPVPRSSSSRSYEEAGIRCTAQSKDSLTFTADIVPDVDIELFVTYQEVRE